MEVQTVQTITAATQQQARKESLGDRPHSPVVTIGAQVTVRYDDGEVVQVTIRRVGEANPRAGIISTAAPLARAILNARIGEHRCFTVEQRGWTVEVLAIAGGSPPDAAPQPPRTPPSRPTLYTIGTSDRTADDFIDVLRHQGVTLVVDVRSKRGSRIPHFDEARFGRLSAMLDRHGIVYDESLHLPLGGDQHGKMTLGNFQAYARSAAYKQALAALRQRLVDNRRGETVILCCERDPRSCHRRIIAESLARHGWRIVHL